MFSLPVFPQSVFSLAAPALEPVRSVPLTVASGVPLRIALEKKLTFKQAGAPVRGRLAEPIYAFDRMVVPAGTEVLGQVVRYDRAPRKKRIDAILGGDFTPLKQAKVEFNTLVLADGRRLPISTNASPGTKFVIQLQAAKKQAKAKQTRSRTMTILMDKARQDIEARTQGAIQVVKSPGKLEKLKELGYGKLPYHPQWLPAGTRFDAELLKPLDFGMGSVPESQLVRVGSQPPADSVVFARLLTQLNSGTTPKGTSVEAVVTQPLFSPEHQLILPEGSLLKGTVVLAQPARKFHRTGQLRYVFQRIESPIGPAQIVEGSLEGTQADSASKMAVDAEGGVRTVESKVRYIAPALAVLLATASVHQEHEKDGDVENNSDAQAGAGGIGFGLVGAALSRTSRFTGAGFGYSGAAWSIYRNFLSRGLEVNFAHNAPMSIRFGTHHPSEPKLAPKPKPTASMTATPKPQLESR